MTFFLLAATFSFSQNLPPVVEQLAAIVDTSAQTITLSFNVFDHEQDTLEISLSLSNDGGATFNVPVDSPGGDIGWPVLPGMEKQIIWHYSPQMLNFDNTVLPLYKAKIIADDRLSQNLHKIADQVDSLRLKETMQAIVGIRNYITGAEHLANVKEYLKYRLSSGSLDLIVQPFMHDDFSAENIIGSLSGQTNKEILFAIGAHYDTVESSPGADDNGSGVAGTLEIAQILSGYQFRHSLHFIAFDIEEIGAYGSKEYAGRARQDSTDLQGMINLDMIGFYSNEPYSQDMRSDFEQLFPEVFNAVAADDFRANFVSVITNTASFGLWEILSGCIRQFVPQLKVVSFAVSGNGEDYSRFRSSDHASFWDEGFKAIMMDDTAGLRNSIYHTPADTIGSLNFTFMTNIVKAAVTTMARLGEIQHYGVGVTDLAIANTTAVAEQNSIKPQRYNLAQNYPNPFNPQTRIDYALPEDNLITIKLYNTNGQELQTIMHKYHQAGSYSLNFNAASLPCGLYLYTLQAGEQIVSCKKMLLIK